MPLVPQAPLIVSALPQLEPMILLHLLYTSLWVSRKPAARVFCLSVRVCPVHVFRCYQCCGRSHRQPFKHLLHQLVLGLCSCVAFCGNQKSSVTGCVLTGDSQPMDVCSVHHDDMFLRYSVSLLGYGFYGDVLTDSERKRWLGPARYDLSGMKPIIF